MTNEHIMILVGGLMILLGVLLIVYLTRLEKATTTSGKSTRGQLIVITVGLIVFGVILMITYSVQLP